MALDAKEIAKLKRIIGLAEKLIAENQKPKRGRPASHKGGAASRRNNGKRIRRTGKDLIQFRKMLNAERKKGVSVSELARTHRISPAYIYQL